VERPLGTAGVKRRCVQKIGPSPRYPRNTRRMNNSPVMSHQPIRSLCATKKNRARAIIERSPVGFRHEASRPRPTIRKLDRTQSVINPFDTFQSSSFGGLTTPDFKIPDFEKFTMHKSRFLDHFLTTKRCQNPAANTSHFSK